MAVTASPRLGLTRWSAGSDPVSRVQFDGDHGRLDDLTAIDLQGLAANRPAAGIRGRYYFTTDTGRLYRDTGALWVEVISATAALDYKGTATPTAATPGGGAGAAGAANLWAPIDHRHATPNFGAPAATAIVSSNGASADVPRADHGHAIGTIPRAKIFRASAFAIVSGVQTEIPLTSTSYDTDAMTGGNLITIQRSGLYLILASVRFAGGGPGGYRYMQVSSPSSGLIYAVDERNGQGDGYPTVLLVAETWVIAAGTTLRLTCLHDRGSNLDVLHSSSMPYLSVTRLGG